MTNFLKIAKSIAVHFAHICAYGVETVKGLVGGAGRGMPPTPPLTFPCFIDAPIDFPPQAKNPV